MAAPRLELALVPAWVFGASGHARVVVEILRAHGVYRAAGLIDREAGRPGVTATENELPQLVARTGVRRGVVAVGDNHKRRMIVRSILEMAPGFEFVTVIHPSAVVAPDAEIGAGTVVAAGAIVNPGAGVGEHVILNTASVTEHDCHVGDFASLGPGALMGGGSRIEEASAVAIGAKVLHGISIGRESIVGAGAVATRDVPEFTVAYGVPARVVRVRKTGEPYL